MSRILHVMRHEIYSLISRPSFWLAMLGVPVFGFLIYGAALYINGGGSADSTTPSPAEELGSLFEPEDDTRPQGYVDQSGIVAALPPWLQNEETLRAYASEDDAAIDLQDGKISAYYVIPPDYLENGRLPVFTSQYSLVSWANRADELEAILLYNLLGQDTELAMRVMDPLPGSRLEVTNLSPQLPPPRDPSDTLTFFLPYGVMMLFYMSILGTAGMLLNSVTKEKENRVLEILMVSITPYQMLLGKIAGLGLVGLMQIAIWGLSAYNLLRMSGQAFNFSEAIQLHPSILGWGLLFFLLGYLLYAALMSGIGALVPSLREASQATTLLVIPLMIPLFLLSGLIRSPNGPLAVFFSLFPLTAPTSMMLRLSIDAVPLWQILLSAVLLAATALLVVRSAAGMFRAQNLLSGQSFSLKRYLRALAGK